MGSKNYEVKTTKTGKITEFTTLERHSGITVQVHKEGISVWGWYDSMVGIDGFDISHDELYAAMFKAGFRPGKSSSQSSSRD